MNPIDGIPGLLYRAILPWLAFPAVIGSDVAGEIVEVGADVTRLRAAIASSGTRSASRSRRTARRRAPSSTTSCSCSTWSRPSPTRCPSRRRPCCR
ncbi:hypothetical protein [Actinomadura bangladeshensis]|uniref:hypothetical protein n=1 Tax=Actinomadura bangladeshensis TaxID=453573 RepID=UPI003B8A7D16